MAVNINKVYERVLFIANKEQRGYITPDEFNSFATQAQLEIFESYFLKKFQVEQAPGTTDDYSDASMIVEEKLTFFDNTATVPKGSNGRYNYADVPNFYRLGTIIANNRMADEVSHKDLTYINLSPLTAPTPTQPVFTRHEGGITLYPTTFADDIQFVYLRKPVDPSWAQRVGTTADVTRLYPNGATQTQTDSIVGVPFYDATNSVDFELHPAEEQELVYKILTLSGVTIKQQDIASFGQGKDQQLQATEV